MCDLHRPSSEAEASGASICCRAEKSEMPIRLCVNNTIDRGPIDAQRSVRMRVFRFLLGFFSLLPSIEGGLRGGGGSEGGPLHRTRASICARDGIKLHFLRYVHIGIGFQPYRHSSGSRSISL